MNNAIHPSFSVDCRAGRHCRIYGLSKYVEQYLKRQKVFEVKKLRSTIGKHVMNATKIAKLLMKRFEKFPVSPDDEVTGAIDFLISITTCIISYV